MPRHDPQQHLAALQGRWLLHDPGAAAITANVLEDIIHSIFGDPARIGYELQFALQNRERYRLLHVRQAGSRAPKASVFSDPVGSIEAGQLLLCGAVVRIVGQDG